MRDATVVEILAAPPSIRRASTSLHGALPLSLPLRGAVEQFETPTPVQGSIALDKGNDPDRIPRGQPLDLVTGLDAIALGDRLGDRHLQLAGYPWHVLDS
jgi:hypothetical protein